MVEVSIVEYKNLANANTMLTEAQAIMLGPPEEGRHWGTRNRTVHDRPCCSQIRFYEEDLVLTPEKRLTLHPFVSGLPPPLLMGLPDLAHWGEKKGWWCGKACQCPTLVMELEAFLWSPNSTAEEEVYNAQHKSSEDTRKMETETKNRSEALGEKRQRHSHSSRKPKKQTPKTPPALKGTVALSRMTLSEKLQENNLAQINRTSQ
ncbi:hypothetical protein EYF80_012505 [Liparis tanakae]|uniref:Uncharacterized protein n=1 Tax=Liparis tanakae TaxID=230148 RepID=A0A4Z2IH83_9TELE|nr:hypothetical protein EYF80_012505 [Liparis tanakae]